MHILFDILIIGGIGFAVYKLLPSFGTKAPVSTVEPKPHDARDDQPGDLR